MGRLLNIVTKLHQRTARDYLARMTDAKVHCSEVARRFGRDYWDGERRYGYGGYKYDGRWAFVARQLIEEYSLKPGARILTSVCGRGHLLYEFAKLIPRCDVTGSTYQTRCLREGKRSALTDPSDAREPFPFTNGSFDLAISVNSLHNLPPEDIVRALSEMERAANSKYLVVESFRSPEELFNLQCWALTCETFLRPESWYWLFSNAGYSGEYEFIFFEPAVLTD